MLRRTLILWAGAGLLTADERPNLRVAVEPRRKETQPNIRVDSTLAQINVSVTTTFNRVVTGLEMEHFRLFEDKVEQPLHSCAVDDAPISVGLVFDVSGSMGEKLHKARQAAAAFMRTANPEDEFFLVQFNDRPELTAPFTQAPQDLLSRMMFTRAKGRTALLDGVYLAINEMKRARHGRKAILILSDGADNSSRYTDSEIRRTVREADVMIYAMGLFERRRRGELSSEERLGPALLNHVTEETGGRHFPVRNASNLPDIATKIGVELRTQYLLSYRPLNTARDGKYRRVEVKVAQPRGYPPLRPRYRSGYYAPAQ